MVRIRTARPGDAGAIAELHVATWRAAYAGMLPDRVLLGLSPNGERGYWRRAIAASDHEFSVHVAEGEGGELLGYGSAGRARPNGLPFAGEVYTLYVSVDHQERGLGRRLLFAMFAQFRRQGLGSAMLWVLAANPSRFFYRAMGGALTAERRARHFGVALDELAYGWADLETPRDARGTTCQASARGHE